MPFVEWTAGNAVTAGSMQALPQYYTNKNGDAFSVGSSTSTFTSIGSVFVSGGQFADKLLYTASWAGDVTVRFNATTRTFVSGASLGGGSIVDSIVTTADGQSVVRFVEIGSNQGWIPSENAVIFLQLNVNASNVTGNLVQQTIWGLDKP